MKHNCRLDLISNHRGIANGLAADCYWKEEKTDNYRLNQGRYHPGRLVAAAEYLVVVDMQDHLD